LQVRAPSDDDIALVSGALYTLPSPFVTYSQLMLLYGDMCDIINNVPGTWKREPPSRADFANGSPDDAPDNLCLPRHPAAATDGLADVEGAIARTYADLPAGLQWSSHNFKQHHAGGTGPAFVQLHLWHNAILVMLHGTPAVYPKARAAEMTLTDRLAVVTHCCLRMSQIVEIADVSRGYGLKPGHSCYKELTQGLCGRHSWWISVTTRQHPSSTTVCS